MQPTSFPFYPPMVKNNTSSIPLYMARQHGYFSLHSVHSATSRCLQGIFTTQPSRSSTFFFFFPQKTHTLPNHSFGHPAWSRLIIGHRPVHSDWSSNATGPKLRRSETRSVGPLEKILFSTWSRVCPQSSQPPYPIQWEETWESQKRNKPCSRLEGRSPSSPGAQMLWAAGQRSNLPSLYPI